MPDNKPQITESESAPPAVLPQLEMEKAFVR
jgi:hypothetical protein